VAPGKWREWKRSARDQLLDGRRFLRGNTDAAPDVFTGSTGWSQTWFQTTAPSDAAFMRIEARLNGTGTLWADDFQANVS